MKTILNIKVIGTLLACLGVSGCAMFGIVRRVPLQEIRNESVAIPPGADFSRVIVSAAQARKWTARVTAPDVVRCQFNGRAWNIEVDVRHSGQTFSIDYVSSEGLFYEPETRSIHGTYNRQVEALRQRIIREASRAPVTSVAAVPAAGTSPAAVAAPAPAAKPYTIKLFEREAGDLVSYRFVLALTDATTADLALSRRIQADLRESVRADYAASAAVKDAASLRIEFPQYAIREGTVEGRAVVLTVSLLEFVYDPVTAQGRLAVKVNPQQYEQTRQWVRDNIATLARDKDPSLFSALSGRSRFSIGREVLRDDNVLEVEFHTGN